MYDLQEMAPGIYLMPKTGGMRVPGLVIASKELLAGEDIQEPLNQVYNVAHLPGIVGYSIAMPDMHWGYGFPIGGVAATNCDDGVISPGGVGYDINCGVCLAIIPIPYEQLRKENLIESIFKEVPSGVGRGHIKTRGLSDRDYAEIATQGVGFAIKHGVGFEEDIKHIENNGLIMGADISCVSAHAKERGKNQLGSIGSGNHFIEIGVVQRIDDAAVAEAWDIEQGHTYLLIHSGSRGFGHQICQDTLNEFIKKGFATGLPDKQLVCAPLKSQEGQRYFAATAVAANFAFNNRLHILHEARQVIARQCGIEAKSIRLVYDVCHNIAKFEEHQFEGAKVKLCVHRKGATRAFGPGAEELAPIFKKTGQPVLVPGDMGRASYLMVGQGNELTWCSSCHGAGRARSRVQSKNAWRHQDILDYMSKCDVKVVASSMGTIAEEMPDAYKNVNEVVEAVQEAKLAKIVAKLRPHLVVKG